MKIAISSLFVAVVAANPFAPVSKNNAKTKYINNLIRGATPTRKLEQNNAQQAEAYEIDISGYSVKFDKCQFVKTYSDEMAENADYATVLETKRFAVFRLCPSSCGSCDYNYGEYLVDLDEYLAATVEYFQNYQQEMCNNCQECGNNQNNANRNLQQYQADCSTCYDECQKIENMQDNGYYDATDFLECKMIYAAGDDDIQRLYAAPICASQGQKIKIGVFTDENCRNYDSTKDVDDYLMSEDGGYQMKLSHALLKMTYQDTCISCKEPEDQNENNQGNDAQDADTVIELCENLYDMSAKCEYPHGFKNGYGNYEGYENQLAQEGLVCNFIKSIEGGTYDEQGQINVKGASAAIGGGSHTTGGQKFALTFFILGTVGLAAYAAVLHSKLTKGSS